MRKYDYLIYLFLAIFSANISIGQGITMEIDGTQGGLLINRLTNLERNAIATPPDGLIIFNLDTGCLNYYFSTKWYEWCGIEVPTCDTNPDCPSGQICVNGVCENDPGAIPCETVEQCPTGFDCVDGFCTLE